MAGGGFFLSAPLAQKTEVISETTEKVTERNLCGFFSCFGLLSLEYEKGEKVCTKVIRWN